MTAQVLTYKYQLRPTPRQYRALEEILEQQRQLYNAALAERIDAYRKAGLTISEAQQSKSLTQIRGDDPAFEIDDVVAASLPVAYLTAQVTQTLAGFKPGMTVLAPGIGGSVGNATYQLARAQGAGKVISTAGSAAKAAKARALGFVDVVDLTAEGLAEGVSRITAGKGVDIVIESIGGTVTSEALSSLSLGGVLITLGYSAGRKSTIDVTDRIWKRARMAGFSLFAQSPAAVAAAWRDVIPLMVSGSVKPIVERVYRLSEAGEALRHLIEDRPFGKVVLAG
jgi:NADPH2:quinone reductase